MSCTWAPYGNNTCTDGTSSLFFSIDSQGNQYLSWNYQCTGDNSGCPAIALNGTIKKCNTVTGFFDQVWSGAISSNPGTELACGAFFQPSNGDILLYPVTGVSLRSGTYVLHFYTTVNGVTIDEKWVCVKDGVVQGQSCHPPTCNCTTGSG